MVLVGKETFFFTRRGEGGRGEGSWERGGLGGVCALPFLGVGVLGGLVAWRLDGAGVGLQYMFWFDWWQLLEWKLWIDAFTQVVFQYFIGLAVNKNVKMILDPQGERKCHDANAQFGPGGLGPNGVCPEETFGKIRFLFSGILLSF